MCALPDRQIAPVGSRRSRQPPDGSELSHKYVTYLTYWRLLIQ
jgi:hypothetical protein